jgi:outer membrane protein assembly factor BamB
VQRRRTPEGDYDKAGADPPVLGVNTGFYGAINALTGKIAWAIPILTCSPYSGMALAGNLVFFGDSSGVFYAANAAMGEILWVFDAWGATGGNASAAVYEAGGVEYVVYGFGGEPGKAYELGDAVIAFALPSAGGGGRQNGGDPQGTGAAGESQITYSEEV